MRLAILDPEKCIGCQCCMFACSRRSGSAGLAASCIGVRSAGGMASGFVIVVCRGCDDPPCAKVCPTNALTLRKGGGVRLDAKKCTGCGNCRDACILDAVYWDHETEKPMICVHCGYCADYCPYGVLAKENKPGTVLGKSKDSARMPAASHNMNGAKGKRPQQQDENKKSGGRK